MNLNSIFGYSHRQSFLFVGTITLTLVFSVLLYFSDPQIEPKDSIAESITADTVKIIWQVSTVKRLL